MLNLCSSWTESKKANQPHSVQINPNLTILYQREWSYFPMSHARLVHTSTYSDQQTCIFLFACEYIRIQIKYLSHELMQYLSLSLRFSCINTRLKNAASLQATAVTSYVILKSSQGWVYIIQRQHRHDKNDKVLNTTSTTCTVVHQTTMI